LQSIETFYGQQFCALPILLKNIQGWFNGKIDYFWYFLYYQLLVSLIIKGAVCQAIQVLKPYKYDNNIMWVYTITGRLSKQPFSLYCDQLQ